MAVQTQIQTRRGTAASWTSTNPTLAAGEIGFESDTNKFKIGTGSTAWASLAYASNVSPLTTKGDLYTYSTDNTRLAVGANGETIVADSSTSTGLRYQGNFAAGKNAIINGDFRINQRAFTSTTSNNAYGFDRFYFEYGTGTSTYSAQTFTVGTAPVSGYESANFARVVTTGQTGSCYCVFGQKIEDVRTFAGQTITISFWAKAGSGTPKISAAVTQIFGSGGSSVVITPASSAPTITTSWARYSFTINVPSISGKTIGTGSSIAAYPILSDNAILGSTVGAQNNTFDIWGVQVEAGSVATAFQTATGTIQGELAACQRYYYRNAYNGTGSGNYLILGDGQATSTTGANIIIDFPVTMRNEPQSVDFAGLIYGDYTNNIAPAITSITIYASRRSANLCILQTVGSAANLTAGNTYYLLGNGSGTSYVGLSAEL
jgi:hypothetical protein